MAEPCTLYYARRNALNLSDRASIMGLMRVPGNEIGKPVIDIVWDV